MKGQGRAIAILFVTMFLVMLGFGILIPVMPFYVRTFGGNATTLGFLMATYSVLQLVCAPFWGRLSDRIGRRPVLLIGLAGYGLTFILYGFATQLWMLFATRALAGLISSATLPTALAYVSDVTAPEDRAKGMGLMGAAIGMGIVTGPAVGGLASAHSLSLPFFIAGGVALLNLPFAWRFLPESLDLSRPRVASARPRLSLQLLSHPRFPLLLMALIASFALTLFESTFALFSADRFGFSPLDMGVMFGTLGIVGAGLQGGGLGRLARKFGELPLLSASLGLSILGYLAVVAAASVPFLWAATALFTLSSSMMRPLISTLTTRTSEEGREGATVGIQQSFDSLGRIAGPSLGGILYEVHGSAPYLLGAAVLVLAFFAVRPRLPQPQR